MIPRVVFVFVSLALAGCASGQLNPKCKRIYFPGEPPEYICPDGEPAWINQEEN